METPREEQLAADLRALRPTPRPGFVADLDERAAAGFPRRSRFRLKSPPDLFAAMRNKGPARLRRLLLPAGGAAVAVVAVATVLVVANQGGSTSGPLRMTAPEPGGSTLGDLHYFNGSGSSAEPAPTGRPEEASGTIYEAESPAAGNAAAAGSGISAGRNNRAVERSAELVFGADPADLADDASKVFEAVHAHDGIVMRSSTREGEPGVAAARFELLIPSAKLGDALAALSAIDEVRSRHEATDDITAPTVQTGELLQDSRARIDSLLAQLEAAETESERETVEAELAAERRHRARLRAQLQHLERRADYSRVLVRIETGASEGSSGGAWGVDDALGDAGHILAVAAAVAVVALAILGPIAFVALLAWLTHRAWVRRERRRVLS